MTDPIERSLIYGNSVDLLIFKHGEVLRIDATGEILRVHRPWWIRLAFWAETAAFRRALNWPFKSRGVRLEMRS